MVHPPGASSWSDSTPLRPADAAHAVPPAVTLASSATPILLCVALIMLLQ
jgi:hypothetical protein